MPPPAIGIDFGARHAVLAAATADGPTIITTPAAVWFAEDGATVVGDAAVAAGNPDRVVHRVRDRLGDPAWSVDVDGVAFGAVDVAAILLREVVHDATALLGAPGGAAGGAVITVPAYFHDGERTGVVEAARSAGIPILQIMNEPTAVALAYAGRTELRGTVLVYDLEVDSFDATLLEIESPDRAGIVGSDGLRAKNDGLCAVADTEGIVRRTLKGARIRPRQIDAVLLAGERVHAPEVGTLIRGMFDCELLDEIDGAEVVALGAAIHAATIAVSAAA